MAHMMADLQMKGQATSGYGVRLAGFYSQVSEFARNVETEIKPSVDYQCVAQCEVNGYALCLVAESANERSSAVKAFTYRREPHRFFQDLGEFLKRSRAQSVVSIVLTESYGNILLTMLATTVENDPGV